MNAGFLHSEADSHSHREVLLGRKEQFFQGKVLRILLQLPMASPCSGLDIYPVPQLRVVSVNRRLLTLHPHSPKGLANNVLEQHHRAKKIEGKEEETIQACP